MEVEPYYEADLVTLYLGDCRDVMRAFSDASVDAIVTDPPYELGFMGKHWDGTGIAYSVEMWREALRVLKPGGYLLAFGGTRTYHRMAVAIEDAGFEVRDCLAWMYGSGFPKSLDVSKAIESHTLNGGSNSRRLRKTEQDGDGEAYTLTGKNNGIMGETVTVERKAWEATTDAARQWDGWGTALKPAYEPVVMARKPLEGTVAANVLAHGTGAINVDATRIGTSKPPATNAPLNAWRNLEGRTDRQVAQQVYDPTEGRWPANVLLDEEAAAILDRENEECPSRFFYTAKAARSEREAGVDVEPARRADADSRDDDAPGSNNPRLRTNQRRNDHPTVKPVDVMRWLCRLVTPPGGVVLDPFNGSGTTGMAALDEGFRYIGIEQEPRYIEIARQRITHRHVIETAQVEPNAELVQGRML